MSSLYLEFFGWLWVGAGVLSGAVLGLFFGREEFLGGYDAWARRLVRLGHIAFFGTGMLCVLMAGTLERRAGAFAHEAATLPATAMASGALLMPVCCGVAAWRKRAGVLFGVPVALIGAAVTFVYIHLGRLALAGGWP